MKWKRSSVIAAVALMLSAISAPIASAADGAGSHRAQAANPAETADPADVTGPIGVTALAEVTPLGLMVTGVALEYDTDLGAGEVVTSAFAVETDLPAANPDADPADVSRTITAAYTSPSAHFQTAPAAGNYLILELSAEDDRAGATSFDGTFTHVLDVDESLTVTQLEDVTLPGAELAANPEAAYQSTNSVRLIADDYATDVLSAANGIELPYRLFRPDTDAQVPLVVSLHGHGESGTNNMSQIVGNQISVSFAAPERQASNPAYVLSPQTQQGAPLGEDGVGWWIPQWQDAVIELVEKTIAENPNIDEDRVYLTGLSMGGFGSWAILPNHSDLFAAAVIVCGAGDEQLVVENLADFPIWALHSIDDFVVEYDVAGSDYRIFQALENAGSPVVWSQWAANAPQGEQNAAAQEAVTEAAEIGSHHIFTTFPEDTTLVMPHFSWVPTYSNDVVLDWLFDHERVEAAPEPEPTPEPGPEPDPEPEPEPEIEDAVIPESEDADPVVGSPALDELPRTGTESWAALGTSLLLTLAGVGVLAARRWRFLNN